MPSRFAQAVLDLAELRNVLHRAGTVKRHKGDDILDAGRLHALERVHHARAFHLEHRHRARIGIELIGFFVIQRDGVDVDLDAALPKQVKRVLDDRQGFEAEEIVFDQPRLFDPFHVELSGRHIRTRVLIKRHQRNQRVEQRERQIVDNLPTQIFQHLEHGRLAGARKAGDEQETRCGGIAHAAGASRSSASNILIGADTSKAESSSAGRGWPTTIST